MSDLENKLDQIVENSTTPVANDGYEEITPNSTNKPTQNVTVRTEPVQQEEVKPQPVVQESVPVEPVKEEVQPQQVEQPAPAQTVAETPVEQPVQQKVEEVPPQPVAEQPAPAPVAEEPKGVNENVGYISDTFRNLQETEKVLQEGVNTKDILGNIKVDLSSIEIIDELDTISETNLEESLFNDKSTKMVTCCQSSYWAELSALKSQEIQSLDNSDSDFYNYKKKLYQLIHKHMENTSVGKMDYGNWLHNTSFLDIETLLYGIYCQTFDYENKYTIGCPNCERTFDIVTNNNSLIETRGQDEQIFAKIDEIISTIHNQEELLNNSHVHKTNRVILDESKIIFDIRIPSAYDYLEGVASRLDNEALEEYQNAIGLSLFISDIYLPNILLLKQTGKLNYIKLKLEGNASKLITTISNLTYYDSIQLTDSINEFVDKYRISYGVNDITCPNCGHKIRHIPLDMETLLFNTIRRASSGR